MDKVQQYSKDSKFNIFNNNYNHDEIYKHNILQNNNIIKHKLKH